MIRILARLRRDQKGATAIEFAMIAPVFFLMTMAIFDLSYRAYITSVLQGEMQKAGRDGSLEGGASAATTLDARVTLRVKPLVQNGVFEFNRKNFVSFTRSGMSENFTDSNANGARDAGECFEDENANAIWDSVSGRDGQGGADDITQYTVTLTYGRIFPLYGLLGWSPNQVIKATTVLRNQPFSTQQTRTTTVVCT